MVQRHGNEFYRAAAADMQGWRTGHEDGHDVSCEGANGSFWVLDGHGGAGCARYCTPKLGEAFVKGPFPEDERIEQTLATVDADFHEYVQENPDQDAGSTVVGCITQRNEDGSFNMKMTNCGDSRGLIVFGPDEKEDVQPLEVRLAPHLVNLESKNIALPAGTTEAQGYEEPNKGANPKFCCRWPVICESVDHKPSHPTERSRIELAGGFVSLGEPARLDGNLAVSRCLGDFEYKGDKTKTGAEQKCSNFPDIYEVSNVPAGSFIVLACDGLWDVCTGEYIANYVRDELKKNPKCDLGEMAAHLIKWSLAEKNTKDNVTVMIIQLADGSEWSCVPDEMKGWEKLAGGEEQLEDDARRQYLSFLSRCKFPDKPTPCGRCRKWARDMWQCPCKTACYCCRTCQKKDFKMHKATCPMLCSATGDRTPTP